MIPKIEKSVTDQYIDYVDRLIKDYNDLNNIVSNRHGIILGVAQAILDFQITYGKCLDMDPMNTIRRAYAWIEWAAKIPRDMWVDYDTANNHSKTFERLWKAYIACGTSKDFMNWLDIDHATVNPT